MVKHHQVRSRLLQYLHRLADEEHQRRVWLHHVGDASDDDFDAVIHFFYDDTELADRPEWLIGWVLEDEHEAKAVTVVVDALNRLRDLFLQDRRSDLHLQGTNDRLWPDNSVTVEMYLQSQEWPAVVEAARAAEAVLKEKPAS